MYVCSCVRRVQSSNIFGICVLIVNFTNEAVLLVQQLSWLRLYIYTMRYKFSTFHLIFKMQIGMKMK